MDVVGRVVVFGLGALMVGAVVGSAVRTVVLPRAAHARLTTLVFIGVRQVFDLRLLRATTYEQRDRVMAPYAPLSLITLTLVWLLVVGAGYTAMFWTLGGRSLRESIGLSGSSLFTLGFVHPDDLPAVALALSEAAMGLALLALIITYLPSLYTTFSRREAAVTHLEVRAGSPPSGVEMLERYALIDRLDALPELWDRWEDWFVEVQETHTSFPVLVFFRSPQPEHSWITAAGAVLDAAALTSSTLADRDPDAELLIRAGYLALRRVADYFRVPYDPEPAPDDPITVARDEFDAAYDRLAAAGLRLEPDRERAWRDFAGWRVNYDTVLLSLASLVMAPYAPWSSDRSPTRFRRRILPTLGARGRKNPRLAS